MKNGIENIHVMKSRDFIELMNFMQNMGYEIGIMKSPDFNPFIEGYQIYHISDTGEQIYMNFIFKYDENGKRICHKDTDCMLLLSM